MLALLVSISLTSNAPCALLWRNYAHLPQAQRRVRRISGLRQTAGSSYHFSFMNYESDTMPQNDRCENCGHDQLKPFIDRPGHRVLCCPKCQLYQGGVLESNDIYEDDYHEEYRGRLAEKIRTALIRLGSLHGYLNEQPAMLDVGCSVGATLRGAEQLGWKATGVDVSQAAVDICRANGLDAHVIQGPGLPFEDATFDVLTNWHVIEHVEDVLATLAEWNRVLKPGGIMILETPNSSYLKARILRAQYRKFWPAIHLYTFNRQNLSSLLSQSGFELLPTRLVGGWNALPLRLNAYALAYRGLREVCRAADMSKSFELTCRKANSPVRPSAAAA